MGSFIVVEDDFSMRYLIQAVLKSAGHKVLAEVETTASAKLHLESGKIPDVILVDMVLPGQPGFDFVGHLREAYKGVKVVVCTGLNEERVLQMLPPGSYDAYIQKPFDTEAFLARVGQLAGGK